MAVTTVAQFAAELNRPAAALLEQLQSADEAKTLIMKAREHWFTGQAATAAHE